MTTISEGASSLEAAMIVGFSSSRSSRNIVHDLVSTSEPAVDLAPAGLRTGTLQLLLLTAADALAMESLHALAVAPLTLTDPDWPDGLPFTYVLQEGGQLTLDLDSETQAAWLLTVPYQEVTA